jgi:hypothetical protein
MNLKPLNWVERKFPFTLASYEATTGEERECNDPILLSLTFRVSVQKTGCVYVLVHSNLEVDSEAPPLDIPGPGPDGGYETIEDAKRAAEEWLKQSIKAMLED